MTRHGKCETCRRRKVKCDEVYPMCGPCSVKRRPCKYNNSVFIHDRKSLGQTDATVRLDTPEIDVSLSRQRRQKAEAGQGEFITFEPTPPQTPSPPPAPICPESGADAPWGSVFGYEALNLCPFGAWLELSWPTGVSKTCLELAARYVKESALAFQLQYSEESMARASSVGVEALRSLQDSISAWPEGVDRESLIVAVMLHFGAEKTLGIATWRHIPHLRGLCRLLASCPPEDVHNLAIQSVINSICAHEIVTSILLGEPSQLEDIPRPEVLPQGPPQLDLAAQVIDDLLIKLPRLVCLVRAAMQDYDDLQSMAMAVETIKELYNSDAEQWVRQAVEASSQTAPNPDTAPFTECLEFKSGSAFMVAIRYFGYRMILCGLLQTLTSIDQYELFLDKSLASEARAGSIDAARSTAMCLKYAIRPSRMKNLLAMEMLWPLEACMGIFHIQANESPMGTLEYSQAVKMVEWCVENLCSISQRWRAGVIPRCRMLELYDVFRGGPLVPDAFDYEGIENNADVLQNTWQEDFLEPWTEV